MSNQADSTIQPSKRHRKLQTIWNWLKENGPVLVTALAIAGALNHSIGKDFDLLRTEMNAGFQLVDLRFQAVEDNIDDIEVDIKDIKQDIGVLQRDVSVLQRDVSVLQRDVSQIKGRLAVTPDDEPHFPESDADP